MRGRDKGVGCGSHPHYDSGLNLGRSHEDGEKWVDSR